MKFVSGENLLCKIKGWSPVSTLYLNVYASWLIAKISLFDVLVAINTEKCNFACVCKSRKLSDLLVCLVCVILKSIDSKNKMIISRWQSLNDEKMMLIEFLLTGIIHIYIIDKNMILQELYKRL